MGILSSSVSITRYKVEGKLEKPISENVCAGLKRNCIGEIDDRVSDRSTGWACFDNPFSTDFNRSSFLIGTTIVFSMRVDKKNIPSKVVKKKVNTIINIKLKESGRNFISKQEKKNIKDIVISSLTAKVPATPHVYDVIWQHEDNLLLFFSVSKNSNEELESLFYKSFKIRLIRLFPFTMANFLSNLSDSEKNILTSLSPTCFTE